jgi:SAM-dependent methyltransferase
MLSPTQRFSNRVEDYIKYRPGYPPEVIDLLRRECGLTPAAVVADIGSGTGILTEMLLKEGCQVFAVEPNREMRAASERLLGTRAGFHSRDGAAEATGLREASVDLITAAQAFHWFDREPAGREFRRILKPGGSLALIWNDRKTDATPFQAAYEELVRQCATDYAATSHKQIDDVEIDKFFKPSGFKKAVFANRQSFDFEGLRGRLLSSSYAPAQGQPGHESMLRQLTALFHAHQRDGRVAFDYDVLVYYGQLRPA